MRDILKIIAPATAKPDTCPKDPLRNATYNLELAFIDKTAIHTLAAQYLLFRSLFLFSSRFGIGG
ncbi:hypothetical protein [Mesorhizobium sp. STM 4661]|uniref:hypothetical protein n=1 Tax=Mesorhizobium sp. STM 4661 TaxID=1297570 RepID=UPI0002BE370B|nr:hypothetical protein [Mesorhizobium sp. STM 4661]CCV12507.1 hypothetical protein MESS4_430153 [Mesorhizobium sp. STM 4661]